MERLFVIGGRESQRLTISDDLCLCQLNDVRAHHVELELQQSVQDIRCGPDVNGLLLIADVSSADYVSLAKEAYGYLSALTAANFFIVLPCADDANSIGNSDVAVSQEIEDAVTGETERWTRKLQAEINVLRKCVSSAAVDERMALLNRWLDKPPCFHILPAVYCLNDSIAVKEECLHKVFQIVRPFCPVSELCFTREEIIVHSEQRDHTLPMKPPGLHWTNWPRPEEVQLTFRFTFHIAAPSEHDFRSLLGTCRRHEPQSEYVFEWVDGILLRFDPVKIFLGRHGNMIELSGRIDLDEMEENEKYPARPIWHHLASYFEITLDMLDDMPRLPYQIHFIPISDQFYEVENGPVREHAFDLTQLMTAIERERQKNRCRFRERRAEGSIEGTLNTERCFPTLRPRSLGHFRSWLRMTDRETVKNSICFRPDNGPHSPRPGLSVNSFLSPSRGRRGSRGEGRRVSFGIISVEGIKLKTIDDPTAIVEKYVSRLLDNAMHELFTIQTFSSPLIAHD